MLPERALRTQFYERHKSKTTPVFLMEKPRGCYFQV